MLFRGPARLSARSRGIASASAGALILKGVSTVTTFVTVPLALRHLGDERYGVWMSINVILAIASFADLGLGNSLVNEIVRARARGEDRTIAKAIGNVLFSLLLVSAFLILLMGIVVPLFPWIAVLHLHGKLAAAEAMPAALVFFVGILLPIAPSIVAQIQIGYEEGFRAAMWSVASALSQLLGITLAIRFTQGLPWLLFGFTVGPFVLTTLSLLIELFLRRPNVRPQASDVNLASAIDLVRYGKQFFLFQVCQTVTLYSDYAIVGAIVGAGANTTYGIAFRLFSAAMLSTYITRGLWPAFGTALIVGDLKWARRIFRHLVVLNALYGVLAGLAGVFIAPTLIYIWLRKDVGLTPGLLEAFGFWLFVMNIVDFLSAISMGPKFLRTHVWLYAFATLAALIARVSLTLTFGLPGVVWGCAIPFALIYVVPMTLHVKKRLALNLDPVGS